VDLENILHNAITNDEYLSGFDIDIVDKDYLFYISGGDARTLLNTVETIVNNNTDKKNIRITKAEIENVLQQKNIIYDKSGEEHFNIISAFIKSIRGSDPDAGLYWLARMLEGGEDPLFIARRMLILAAEDIGNASPNALVLAESAFSAVEKIGMPEARIILAQCVTYLAASPKSNAAYMGITKAWDDVAGKKHYSVPLHLRNAPTKLMKQVGYGSGYKYPHDYDQNFVSENYLPDELKNSHYYFPSENGQEKALKDRLIRLWEGIKNYDKVS
jgi:putative ATPase